MPKVNENNLQINSFLRFTKQIYNLNQGMVLGSSVLVRCDKCLPRRKKTSGMGRPLEVSIPHQSGDECRRRWKNGEIWMVMLVPTKTCKAAVVCCLLFVVCCLLFT